MAAILTQARREFFYRVDFAFDEQTLGLRPPKAAIRS
jgi:hypothetical protein